MLWVRVAHLLAWLLLSFAVLHEPPKRVVLILTGHRRGHFESCGCSGVKAISSISKESALINRTRSVLVREGAKVYVVDVGGNLTGLRHDVVFKEYLKRFDYAAELGTSRKGIDWNSKTGTLTLTPPGERPFTVVVGADQVSAEETATNGPDHATFLVLEPGKPAQRLVSTGLAEEDPWVEALLEKAREGDREDFLRKMIAVAEPLAPTDDPAACGKCHAPAYQSWLRSGHARALATLIDKKRLIDDCVRCHSTNYRASKKIELVRDAPQHAVTCVSCHDLASVHRKDLAKPFKEKLKEKVCVSCHTSENSQKFNFATYVQRVHPGTADFSRPPEPGPGDPGY